MHSARRGAGQPGLDRSARSRAFLYFSLPDGSVTGRPDIVSTVADGRRSQRPLNRRDRPPGIVTKTLIPNTERATARKTGQVVRQVRAAWQVRALRQDRDHPHRRAGAVPISSRTRSSGSSSLRGANTRTPTW